MTTDAQAGYETFPARTQVSILAGARTEWIPTAPGKDFKPLWFEADGWSELMRLEPGAVVPLHRHTGEAHAYTISGRRQMLESGEVIEAGDFAYEAAGTVDSWRAIGDEPCIVHLQLSGRVEYVDAEGRVCGTADSASQLEAYLEWCAEMGREPEPHLVGNRAKKEAVR